MIHLRTILCPVDFSPPSHHAVQYAMALARQYDARLHLVHVLTHQPVAVDPATLAPHGTLTHEEEMERQMRMRLTVIRNEGLNATGAVLQGHVPDTLMRESQRRGVDLIVMGTHGYQGLKRWIIGSVTEQMLRRVKKPLVTITPRTETKIALPHIHRVLITTDFSAGTPHALQYGFSIAEEFQADVTLLHVLPGLPDSWKKLSYHLSADDLRRLTDNAALALRTLAPEQNHPWCKINYEVRHGVPHQEIESFVHSWHPDLLVMNIHGTSLIDRAIMGTTAERVLRAAPCPILAVPPHADPLSADTAEAMAARASRN